MTQPIPDGYQTVTPLLSLKDTREAIEFYTQAFGAVQKLLMPKPDGRGVAHAEIKIGNSIVMLADENPAQSCKSAETLGMSPVGFYLYVEDADSAFKKAVAGGAEVRMPLQDAFWGDRMGQVRDPFGYDWTFATHKKDLTPEQTSAAVKAAYSQKAQEASRS